MPPGQEKKGKGEKGEKGKGEGEYSGKGGKGITKQKEKAKENMVEKEVMGDYKGKGKGKGKGDHWGPYAYVKGYQGFSDCWEKGHKAGEVKCGMQEVSAGGNQSMADCGAVEICIVPNVCQVETEEKVPPVPSLFVAELREDCRSSGIPGSIRREVGPLPK